MKTICWGRGFGCLVKFTIGIFSVFSTHSSFAQLEDNPKVSPGLYGELRKTNLANKLLLEVAIRNDKIPAEIGKPGYQAQKKFET